MVHLLAHTGARFSQIAKLNVGNVQDDKNRILVPPSKKGKGRKPVDLIRIAVDPSLIERLRTIVEDRPISAPLLERWKHKQIKKDVWKRQQRTGWRTASELDRPWCEIIKNAGLPTNTKPYALRDASIIRGLKARLSTRHVAALHDTSVQMIERRYSAYIVDALDDIAVLATLRPLTAAKS